MTTSTGSPIERCLSYARRAVNGEIVVCEKTRMACRRFLDDLEKSKDPGYPWVFDEHKAARPVDFMEKFLVPTKGDYDRMVLMDWQCFIECNLFGWVDKQTGLRRFNEALILVGTGNGKSTITRNRVATVYNLPPHMLGDYSDTSFSTAEQQMQEFLQLTIIPIVQQWEDEFNRKLLTPEEFAVGYRIRFDTDALTRADTLATAQTNQMAIRGGWRKPNEVRQSEYRPPDPYGDHLMSSRDILPLRIMVDNPELLLGAASAVKQEKKEGESK